MSRDRPSKQSLEQPDGHPTFVSNAREWVSLNGVLCQPVLDPGKWRPIKQIISHNVL